MKFIDNQQCRSGLQASDSASDTKVKNSPREQKNCQRPAFNSQPDSGNKSQSSCNNPRNKWSSFESQNEDFDVIEKLLTKGKMVRVLRETLKKDEFVVDHVYKGVKAELIRTKEDIITQNITLLLDYYEKMLEIRQQPLIIQN